VLVVNARSSGKVQHAGVAYFPTRVQFGERAVAGRAPRFCSVGSNIVRVEPERICESGRRSLVGNGAHKRARRFSGRRISAHLRVAVMSAHCNGPGCLDNSRLRTAVAIAAVISAGNAS